MEIDMDQGREDELPPRDDEVYFCGGSSEESYSIGLDESFSIKENELRMFISGTNRSLFIHLNCLPVPSYESRSVGAIQNVFRQVDDHDRVLRDLVTSLNHALFLSRCGATVLRSRLKERVQKFLQNGYFFVLQRMMNNPNLVACKHPNCMNTDSVISYGQFFLSLAPPTLHSGCESCASISQSESYCLECLEDIFNRPNMRANTEIFSILADGGVDYEDVVSAAYHLCVDADTGVSLPLRSFEGNDRAQNQPSNSTVVLRARQQKQVEIDAILNDNSKQALRARRPVKALSSLAIVPPSDLASPQERYKKQGLTPYDRRLAIKSLATEKPPPEDPPEQLTQKQATICYCREEQGDHAVIECWHPNCMIGLFHLDCINKHQGLVAVSSQFECSYCSNEAEGFDSSVISRNHGIVKNCSDQERHYTNRNAREVLEGHLAIELSDGGMGDVLREPSIFQGNPASSSAHAWNGTVWDQDFDPVDGSTDDDDDRRPRDRRRDRPVKLKISAQINFCDIAPFIYVNLLVNLHLHLSAEQIAAVDQWKLTCPASRLLLTPLRVEEGLSTNNHEHMDNFSNAPGTTPRLSQVLAKWY